jgi:hypothetical protein
LGKWREPHAFKPASSRQPGSEALSLFCITAFAEGSIEERALLDTARKRRASIFACDAVELFALKAPAIASCRLPNEGTARGGHSFSAEAFQKVWMSLQEKRQYLRHDWTVKVDPDTVFLPARLQKRLSLLRPPEAEPLYFKSDVGFTGAIEVLSKAALERFHLHRASCRRVLANCLKEDSFLQSCLDMVGADFVEDGSGALVGSSASNCADQARTAFHAEGPASWIACYEAAQATSPVP